MTGYLPTFRIIIFLKMSLDNATPSFLACAGVKTRLVAGEVGAEVELTGGTVLCGAPLPTELNAPGMTAFVRLHNCVHLATHQAVGDA